MRRPCFHIPCFACSGHAAWLWVHAVGFASCPADCACCSCRKPAMHVAASLLSIPLWLPVSVCRWYQGTVQGPDGKLLPGAWKRCGQGLLGCEVAVAASLIAVHCRLPGQHAALK